MFLVALSAIGGCARPNVAPITFGVPDGFVVGRDPVSEDEHVRVENVVYAFHDQPERATLYWPKVSGEVRGYQLMTGVADSAPMTAAMVQVLVVVGHGPGLDSLVRTQEGVRMEAY